jgi:hypothetical protein
MCLPCCLLDKVEKGWLVEPSKGPVFCCAAWVVQCHFALAGCQWRRPIWLNKSACHPVMTLSYMFGGTMAKRRRSALKVLDAVEHVKAQASNVCDVVDYSLGLSRSRSRASMAKLAKTALSFIAPARLASRSSRQRQERYGACHLAVLASA